MHYASRLILLLVLIFGPVLASSASAEPPKEGRWVLRVAGQPFLLLELRRDSAAKGGWSGSLSRPKHFEAGTDFTVVSSVEGPAVVERVVGSAPTADAIELTLRNSSLELTKVVWRPLDRDGGTLEFEGGTAPILPFAPAATDERVADAWNKSRTYGTLLEWPDNPVMAQIFAADQAARQKPVSIDWAVVGSEDARRRARIKALLDEGKLRSGTDFYHAAFVFQHGDKPQDFLLAHSFSVIAAARGRPDATWIAAATLDRYLQNVGQKQIYGTQFSAPHDRPATQEPYDRALIPDSLRKALGIPSLAAQEEQRKDFEARFKRNSEAKP